MSGNTRKQRRNYFIKREFQGKFILKFCILVIITTVIMGGILYFVSGNTATTAFINSRLTITRTSDYILPALVFSCLISVLVVGLATIIVVMYLSHRIAGPLFHVERSIQQIGSGDFTHIIKLRSTDEIAELADGVNKMTKKMNGYLTNIRERSQDLQETIDKLAKHGQCDVKMLKNLRLKKEDLDQSICVFKFNA